jgi:hypothetical protein
MRLFVVTVTYHVLTVLSGIWWLLVNADGLDKKAEDLEERLQAGKCTKDFQFHVLDTITRRKCILRHMSILVTVTSEPISSKGSCFSFYTFKESMKRKYTLHQQC